MRWVRDLAMAAGVLLMIIGFLIAGKRFVTGPPLPAPPPEALAFILAGAALAVLVPLFLGWKEK